MANNEVERADSQRGMANVVQPSQTGMTLAQQVRDMSDAHQLAEAFANTGFAGPFKGKPSDLAVAILKGNSLGIPAHEVGGKIYTVHGTPALYGKTALAIAKSHGYKFERLSYGPTEVSVKITSPDGDQDTITYTYDRAVKEGLVRGNKAQYETRPEKMLWWKVIGEAADQVFPHLTAGMPLKEDWEQSEPISATAERVAAPARNTTSQQPAIEAEPVELSDDDERETVLAVLRSATTPDELNGLKDFAAQHLAAHPEDKDAVNTAWMETAKAFQ